MTFSVLDCPRNVVAALLGSGNTFQSFHRFQLWFFESDSGHKLVNLYWKLSAEVLWTCTLQLVSQACSSEKNQMGFICLLCSVVGQKY